MGRKASGSRWGSRSGIWPRPTYGLSCVFSKLVRPELTPQLEDQSRSRGHLPPDRSHCNDHPPVHHLRPRRLVLHGEPAKRVHSLHSLHHRPLQPLYTPKAAADSYLLALRDAGEVVAVPPGFWRRDHAVSVSCSASGTAHIPPKSSRPHVEIGVPETSCGGLGLFAHSQTGVCRRRRSGRGDLLQGRSRGGQASRREDCRGRWTRR